MLILWFLLAAAPPFGPMPHAPSVEFSERVKTVAERLTAADPSVRERAAAELLAMAPDSTEPLFMIAMTEPQYRDAIRALLPRYGPDGVPRLVWAASRHGRWPAGMEEAALAIAGMGPAVLPQVRKLIESGDEGFRAFGIQALGKMGPSGTDELILLLKNPDGNVRAGASRLLFEMNDPRAANALLDAVRSNDKYVLVYSAIALGNLGDRRATEGLLALLNDQNVFVREAAGSSLAKIYEPRLLEPLVRLLRWDPEPMVRDSTSMAMIKRSGSPLAARLGQRYRPLSYDPATKESARLVYGLWLIATGLTVYGLLWGSAKLSGDNLKLGLPRAAWWSAFALLILGFYWGRLITRISGSVELWLLLACIPAVALVAWVVGTRPEAPIAVAFGCLGAIGVALVAPFLGMLGSLAFSWLAPRFLWVMAALVIGLAALVLVLSQNARTLTPFRRATLLGTLAFYAGYGIGWLALWGHLGV